MTGRTSDRRHRVLVVDDNANLTWSARRLLEISGADVQVAGTAREAAQALIDSDFEVAIIDLMLPDGSGQEIVRRFQREKETRFVLMTGHPRLTQAVCRELPGVGFLAKPFSESDLIDTVQQALPGDLTESDDPLSTDSETQFEGWVGESVAMTKLKKQLRSVAPLNTTVFLLGESGTGKELAAETIHRLSGRSGPFLTVNCGSLPETLIANELFGHEKGSFTGANRAQPGLFERAAGGTVFLDEVTELPLDQQPHLLRVLESRTVTRIGGGAPIPIDVRVIAASNRVDQALVEEKILREDLFYRLMVFPLVLPALRERHGDVPLLVHGFLAEWNRENGTAITCSDEVIRALEAHRWPGNVRELKNTVERLAILCGDGEITEAPDFFDDFAGGEGLSAGVSVGRSIKDLEQELIMATLEHFDYNRQKTAETLGISQKTLYNRLRAYGEESGFDPENDSVKESA